MTRRNPVNGFAPRIEVARIRLRSKPVRLAPDGHHDERARQNGMGEDDADISIGEPDPGIEKIGSDGGHHDGDNQGRDQQGHDEPPRREFGIRETDRGERAQHSRQDRRAKSYQQAVADSGAPARRPKHHLIPTRRKAGERKGEERAAVE